MTNPSPRRSRSRTATRSSNDVPRLGSVDYTDTNPDRRPSPKKVGPKVGTFPEPFRGVWYGYESEPERAVLTVLATQPSVRAIREQVKVHVPQQGGGQKPYYMDVVTEDHAGRKTAWAVRQTEADLARDDTIGKLQAIRSAHGSRFAHEYRVVTYETLDPVAVLNGRQILDCGRDLDQVGREAVLDALLRLGPSVTLDQIAGATGLGERGRRAATALLASGLLVSPPGERLRPDLPLENRARRGLGRSAVHPS